jgi:hypothetical protein
MKIKCKCGCGMEREQFDSRGRERLYIKGHSTKGKIKEDCWNRGKKGVYSEETLEKMREKKLETHFRKGKLASEITKRNISNAKLEEWKDKKQSEQSRKKKLYAKEKARFNISIKPCCEICGSTNNLQKHHWNYDKPLLVNTLCKDCHTIQHIKNFEQSKYAGGIIA